MTVLLEYIDLWCSYFYKYLTNTSDKILGYKVRIYVVTLVQTIMVTVSLVYRSFIIRILSQTLPITYAGIMLDAFSYLLCLNYAGIIGRSLTDTKPHHHTF